MSGLDESALGVVIILSYNGDLVTVDGGLDIVTVGAPKCDI
jgi:hypothetical protein